MDTIVSTLWVKQFTEEPGEELRAQTDEKVRLLVWELGCVKVIKMWECKCDERRKDSGIKSALEKLLPHPCRPKYSEYSVRDVRSIIEVVERGELFGFVHGDLDMPTHLREYFSEF